MNPGLQPPEFSIAYENVEDGLEAGLRRNYHADVVVVGSGAVYGWGQEGAVALAVGVGGAVVRAVRDGPDNGGFGGVERAVLAANDE